jgi:hypothetical protein
MFDVFLVDAELDDGEKNENGVERQPELDSAR